MSLSELSIKAFLDQIDSKSPTPGGGSASALSAAIGVALVRMVGHLTIGRKRYEALNEETKTGFVSLFGEMEIIKNNLTLAIDKDTEAYNQVMAAYRLPKDDESQLFTRNKAIQKATVGAIEVPLGVAKEAYSFLLKVEPFIKYGNPNTLSDMGVGIMLVESAIEGAILNVKINLQGLEDRKLAIAYRDEVQEILEKTNILRDEILKSIHAKLALE
ncbi:MAG: cyclodeaminase/cyclohydrolase family protein [Candidatus Izemoplasmatales bacterium]|nr:cyclodeaminase/cyclohydrolase family protein [Candidatus Izemoplasmatales bacterium]